MKINVHKKVTMIKKKILFFIAFINTINSMDQQSIFTSTFKHLDLLWSLTEQVCLVPELHKKQTEDFKNLSRINQFFHSYYTDEKNQQRIIDFLKNRDQNNLDPRYRDSLSTARFLQFHRVADKINDIHTKAGKVEISFTAQDLEENNTWYLNTTITIQKEYLWDHVIESHNVSKAKLLIDKPYIKIPPYALDEIIEKIKPDSDYKDFLIIFKMLLEKISLDQRSRYSEETELMIAARRNQKEIAQLLLKKGANPFLLHCYLDRSYSVYDTYDHIKRIPNHPYLNNAFTVETGEPEGWLMQMYNEFQKS